MGRTHLSTTIHTLLWLSIRSSHLFSALIAVLIHLFRFLFFVDLTFPPDICSIVLSLIVSPPSIHSLSLVTVFLSLEYHFSSRLFPRAHVLSLSLSLSSLLFDALDGDAPLHRAEHVTRVVGVAPHAARLGGQRRGALLPGLAHIPHVVDVDVLRRHAHHQLAARRQRHAVHLVGEVGGRHEGLRCAVIPLLQSPVPAPRQEHGARRAVLDAAHRLLVGTEGELVRGSNLVPM